MSNPFQLPTDSVNILFSFYYEDDLVKMVYFSNFETMEKRIGHQKNYELSQKILVDRLEIMYYSWEENNEC